MWIWVDPARSSATKWAITHINTIISPYGAFSPAQEIIFKLTTKLSWCYLCMCTSRGWGCAVFADVRFSVSVCGNVSLVWVLAVDDRSCLLALLVYPVPCQCEHIFLCIAVYFESTNHLQHNIFRCGKLKAKFVCILQYHTNKKTKQKQKLEEATVWRQHMWTTCLLQWLRLRATWFTAGQTDQSNLFNGKTGLNLSCNIYIHLFMFHIHIHEYSW